MLWTSEELRSCTHENQSRPKIPMCTRLFVLANHLFESFRGAKLKKYVVTNLHFEGSTFVYPVFYRNGIYLTNCNFLLTIE